MMPLHLSLRLLLVLILTGCALPNRAAPPEAEIVVPAMSNSRATAPLPALTVTLIPSATAISVAEATASAIAFRAITPHPGYPAPVQYPTSYPDPLPPAPPTETPVPFPIVTTLPLTATWFYDADESSASCGYALLARSADGTIVELESRIAAAVPREEAPPLLLSCTPNDAGYGQEEIHVLDPTRGTSIPLDLNRAQTTYQLYGALLSPDGRYLLFDGNPSRYETISSDDFWGLYRADVTTGEVVEMIRYTTIEVDTANGQVYGVEEAYNEAGVVWDSHTLTAWDETGLTVHTTASGDNHLWRFTWDDAAALPYSVGAGSLTVESLDPDVSWPADRWIAYEGPSLPSHIARPILIYQPSP